MFLLSCLLPLALAIDCQVSTPDGTSYDLTPLRNGSPPDYSLYSTDNFEYRANFCNPTFQSCNGDFDGIATQWNIGSNCIAVLARQASSFGVTSSGPEVNYIDPSNQAAGIAVTYRNGDVCIDQGFIERQVRFTINCDKKTSGIFEQAREISPCNYEFVFRSKASCPPDSTPSTTLPMKSKGISRGTWFLITLVIGVSAYLGLGIYVNQKRHGLGVWESIPNREFWGEVPALVKDGIGFTMNKIRGMAMRRSESDEGRVPV